MAVLNYILSLLIIFFISTNAFAKSQNTNESDAFLCSAYIPTEETKRGIPKNLLNAISLVESGKWNNNENRLMPWPWAVNVGGKSHFLPNKEDAVSFVKNQLKRGVQSIDVGCMQVNLYFHGKNFKNVEHAFDPQSNVKYAASFLRNNFEANKSWKDAVATYHSSTDSLGIPYARKVFSIWKNGKVIISNKSKHKRNSLLNKAEIRRKMKESIIVVESGRQPSNSNNYEQQSIRRITNQTLNLQKTNFQDSNIQPVFSQTQP